MSDDGPNGNSKINKDCCTEWILSFCFLFFNFITCQWIRPKRKGEKYCCDCDNNCCFQKKSPCKESSIECNCLWNGCEADYRLGCLAINCGCFIMFISIAAVAINVFPLVMFIVGWATCKEGTEYAKHELCYTLYFNYGNSTNNNNDFPQFPELVLRDYKPENDVTNNVTKHLIQEFVDLSKISLLFSTTANAVSHVLFIWALWCLYIKHFPRCNDCLVGVLKCFKKLCCGVGKEEDKSLWDDKCCGVGKADKDKLPLDPFNDKIEEGDLMEINTDKLVPALYTNKIRKMKDFFSTENEHTNTPLQGERLCHYVTCVIIGFTLLTTTAGVFFWLYCKEDKRELTKETYNLERSTLALYTYSLFRVLVSCFIFSKLMYGIQRRCEELELFVYHINEVYKCNITATGTNVRLSNDTEVTPPTGTKITPPTGTKITSTGTDETLPTGTNVTPPSGTKVKLPTDTKVTLPTGTKVTVIDTEIKLSTDTDVKLPTGTNVTLSSDTTVTLPTDTNRTDTKIKLPTGTNVTLSTDTNVTLPAGTNIGGNKKLSEMVIDYLKEIKLEVELNDFVKGIYITDKNAKRYLKARDRHFVDTAVSTLSWLQLWFLLHWILHIISTFMIMSLLIDAIALHVKAKISHIEQGVGFHAGEIGFLFMFSVLHCFFLFYPCLRAASVTRTRQRVIRKISDKASNEYNAIPKKVMQEFIESMKRRKFSFRLRILCARIPFNLNIAYVSIAFGFVGVIVSLITTVTK